VVKKTNDYYLLVSTGGG